MNDRSSRILIVADAESVDSGLETVLTARGYDVEIAAGGDAALERLAEFEPALDSIVVDVAPPQPDWLTLITRLRRRAFGIPIMVLSDRDHVSDRVAGLDAGADDYLVKPFASEEFLARIAAGLKRHPPLASDRDVA